MQNGHQKITKSEVKRYLVYLKNYKQLKNLLMNKFEIESPIFRHSDLKLIGKKINIQKYNNYI